MSHNFEDGYSIPECVLPVCEVLKQHGCGALLGELETMLIDGVVEANRGMEIWFALIAVFEQHATEFGPLSNELLGELLQIRDFIRAAADPRHLRYKDKILGLVGEDPEMMYRMISMSVETETSLAPSMGTLHGVEIGHARRPENSAGLAEIRNQSLNIMKPILEGVEIPPGVRFERPLPRV